MPRHPVLPASLAAVPTAQDYRSHRRWNPLVHFVLSPLFIANTIVALVFLYRAPSFVTAWAVVMAFALFLLNVAARSQTLRVQDRVIRLEMRLRLASVLPPALAARAHELRAGQLVGLRFASDAELPGLVERCLSGELADANAVKRVIREWQPDLLRA